MFKETGCDAVMIARGALGNPWIFNEIKCAINNKQYVKPTGKEKAKLCIEHFKKMLQLYDGKKGIFDMRKHFGWYLKGLSGAAAIRKKIMTEEKVEVIIKTIESFFDKH